MIYVFGRWLDELQQDAKSTWGSVYTVLIQMPQPYSIAFAEVVVPASSGVMIDVVQLARVGLASRAHAYDDLLWAA